MNNNDFNNELKCNLYRNIKEILHPTISKRNISNYKIILNDDLLPLRIFYPKKVSNLEKIMIYIHGDETITDSFNTYSEISSKIALDYNQLIISIDYENSKKLKLLDLYNKFYDTFKYIYLELIKNGIKNKNITLIGDSTGANAILSFYNKTPKDNIKIKRQILFYPLLSGEYFGKSSYSSINESNSYNQSLLNKIEKYYISNIKYKKDLKNENLFALLKKDFSNYPNTLIICGNADILIDEARKFNELLEDKSSLIEIPFAFHGFLNNNDFIVDYQYSLIEFLKK